MNKQKNSVAPKVWSLAALLKKSKSADVETEPPKDYRNEGIKHPSIKRHKVQSTKNKEEIHTKKVESSIFHSMYNVYLNSSMASEDLSGFDNLQLFNLDGTINSQKRAKDSTPLPTNIF